MKRWILIGSGVVIVLALAYGFFAWQNRIQTEELGTIAPPEIPEVTIESDSYEDGVRTIEGLVSVETPCQTLEATALHSPSGGVRVDLVIPPDEGMCLQRPEERTFSIDIEADEDAPLTVFVNGMQAQIHD